jgi:hypothetical protein
LKSQSVSFPNEKEFWRLLSLQQWKAASEILSLWRAGIYAGAGPVFSCALSMLPALLIQGGRILGMMAPVLIGVALVSCLRLVAPAAFMALHGLTWALHPPLGLGGGPDEYRFWLVSGIPLFPQVLAEVLVCGASILMLFRRMRRTGESAGGIAALLGALAGTILLLIFG